MTETDVGEKIMNDANPQLARAVRLVLATGALASVAFAPPTLAQDQTEKLETIEVVGSRIKRTDIETTQPVFVLERADLQRSGLTQVGDILQQLTTNGASIGLAVNNGNTAGQTQVDLRTCGPQRTLVLVNGRRWVTNLIGAVDLSTVPFAAVERIEVLKDGASAIYGSDAICGVINITMRSNYDGAEASAYVGENEHGDGRKQAYEFTLGSAGDRGSVLVNSAYTKQEPIFAGDRDISSVPLFGFPGDTSAPGRASSTTPRGRFNVGAANGGTVTLNPGAQGCLPNQLCPTSATSQFHTYDFRTDGYNFAPTNYLVQPQETISLYSQARYDITSNVTFRTEALFNERKSAAQLAAQPLTPLFISPDNVYNPFRRQINGAAFRPISFPRVFHADADTYRFGAGFNGSFDLFDRNWSWDTGYSYTTTKFLQIKEGFFNANAVAEALGSSFIDANGVAQCGTPDTGADPNGTGCVPFNVFGGPAGVTQDMVNFVSAVPKDITQKKHYNYTANVSGNLFDLPAGPVGMALGYEYRREYGFTQPDALSVSGAVLGDNPAAPTRGGYSVDELYAEFNVPILKEMAFAQLLELSVAVRYSDYSNFGNTTNPKVGFRWKPFDDLLVRGSYADGFRAPNVSELFLGQTTGFPQVIDPCSATTLNQTRDTAIFANCRAAGVPLTGDAAAGTVAGYNQNNPQINTTFGGNPDLQPEQARNKTLGLVYSPSYAAGLDLYLEWYNIEITHAIGVNVPGTILQGCYNGTVPTNCALITRDVSGNATGNPGEISRLIATTQNFPGGLEVEGFDFTVDYKFDTDWGKFKINWDSAYISYYGSVGQPERGDLVNGQPDPGNLIGTQFNAATTGSLWRLRSALSTNWQYGDWGATLRAQYLSAIDESCANVTNTAGALGSPSLRNLCSDPDKIENQPGPDGAPTPTPENRLEPTWYFDLQATWESPWNGRVAAGVQNLTDEDPPVCFSCFANSYDASYRVPGRFYYVSYTQRF
jgi:iron complex outermembrane receptor protein